MLKSRFPIYDSLDRTKEEKAELRVIALNFVERVLANPKLIPFGNTKENYSNYLTDGTLDNPGFQEFALKTETYFELKDELSLKGIQIFNAAIEHCCSSIDLQKERAQKMIEYLVDHKKLLFILSAGAIGSDDLVKPLFLKKGFYSLAEAWCFVWQQKLAGIELYLLDDNADDIKHLSLIFQPLLKCKKKVDEMEQCNNEC